MAEQRSMSVPVAQTVSRNRSNRDTSGDYRGTDWATISGLIASLKRGALQDRWMDFASHALAIDGHLRTVLDTRTNGVLRADVSITPASENPVDVAAADFCRESYDDTQRIEEFLYHMLYAEFVGWTAAEAVYKRKRGEWHCEPVPIRPRDCRVDPDWYYEVRTYQTEIDGAYGESWIATKERRDKWIIHAPTSGSDTVLTSGDMISCAPSWYFKKELEIGWLQGLERYANGILIARHPSGARTETIGRLQQMLERISFDHAATVEDTVEVQHIAGQMDSAAYDQAVTHFESVQSKILLGSTLNTDVASNGGNRALGESMFATTTLPRLEVLSRRLAETIRRDWLSPLLKFNAGVFGRIPRTPVIEFKLVGDSVPTITRDGIDAGTVTVNELRVSQGLDEWSAEEGGDDIAKIEVAPMPAAFAETPQQPRAQEVATPRPLSMSKASAATTQPETMTQSISAIGGHSVKTREALQIEELASREPLQNQEQ